jgi:hypothetical protein
MQEGFDGVSDRSGVGHSYQCSRASAVVQPTRWWMMVNRAVDNARLKTAVVVSKGNRRAGLCHVECAHSELPCAAYSQTWEG